MIDLTTAQAWAALIVAVGGGALVPTIAKGLTAWLSGAAARERGRNAGLVRQRDDAYARLRTTETERDDAYRKARRYAEHASELRGWLLELGITREQIDDRAPWPRD
ncbi:hypothetical protein [Cellulosimicrobium cellulans]|uniref:hypothetical protein n=1 Tax=Cellulosimicrobium cellulans TaxID=1710 RepID=UPI001BA98CE2|nr:hypothetical protein [Cellulosimicrobium cellulans]QUC01232.1 hypothetical protein J5A69_08745 [Cellulosimicrobium cellulans]